MISMSRGGVFSQLQLLLSAMVVVVAALALCGARDASASSYSCELNIVTHMFPAAPIGWSEVLNSKGNVVRTFVITDAHVISSMETSRNGPWVDLTSTLAKLEDGPGLVGFNLVMNDGYLAIASNTGLGTFYSENSGVTWSYQAINKEAFGFDTIEGTTSSWNYPNHMFTGAYMSKCCAAHNVTTNCRAVCPKTLWGSKDYGATWTMIDDSIQNVKGAMASFGIGMANGIESILFSKDPPSGTDPLNLLSVYQTWDFGKTNTLVWTGTKAKYYRNEALLIMYSVDLEDQYHHIFYSRDDGMHVHTLNFPDDRLIGRFTPLELDDTIMFSADDWNHGHEGDLFIANHDEDEVIDVLQHQVRAPYGGVDFDNVNGLPGIHIVNQYAVDPVDEHSDDDGDGNSGDPEEAGSIITLITFNNGGEWSRIAAPADSLNDCPEGIALEDCYLNLYGWVERWSKPYSEWVQYVYSSISTPGVVIAAGNVGQYLNEKTEGPISTFISFDAGWTWKKLSDSSDEYTFVDYGGVFLRLVPEEDDPNNANNAVASIEYSFTEGDSWESCDLLGQVISSPRIRNDPTTRVVTVFGMRLVEGQEPRGVVMVVDFSNLHNRTCETDDFEQWQPYNDPASPKKCFLGQTTTYSRKKKSVECKYPFGFNPIVETSTCACTMEDYECEEYISMDSMDVCVPADTEPPKICDDVWYKSQGFTLVADTQCTLTGDGAVNLLPIETACPGAETGAQTNGLSGSDEHDVGELVTFAVAIALIVLVFAAAGVVMYKYQTDDSFRERLVGYLRSTSRHTDAERPNVEYAELGMDEDGNLPYADTVGDDEYGTELAEGGDFEFDDDDGF